MLTRTIKQCFTLRSRLDWVPKIFKHPKYNTPGGVKRKQKKNTDEFNEYLKNQINNQRILEQTDLKLRYNEKIEQMKSLDLTKFTKNESIELLNMFIVKQEPNHAVARFAKDFLARYGYDLNIFELNLICKILFINKSKLNVTEYVQVTGLLGKYIGPDCVNWPYIDDDFSPEFFVYQKNQKMFANLLLMLEDNYQTEEPIRQKPNSRPLFELLLYTILRNISFYIKNGKRDLHYPSVLQVLAICSKHLPVGFYPDKKIIPLSHEYERPNEVLSDKAWSEEVSAILNLSMEQPQEFKIKHIALLVEISRKMNCLDDKMISGAIELLNSNLRFLKTVSFDTIYKVDRLATLARAGRGQAKELDSQIKSLIPRILGDYVVEMETELNELLGNISKSWANVSLNQKSSVKSKNHLIVSKLNNLFSNSVALKNLEISDPKLNQLLEKTLSSILGLLEKKRLPDILEVIGQLDCKPEVVCNVLNLVADWVNPAHSDWSTFSGLDKESMSNFKENIRILIEKYQLGSYEHLLFSIDHQLINSSVIAN